MAAFRCPVCSGSEWRELRRIDSVLSPRPAGLTRPEEIHVTLGRCRGCGVEFDTGLLAGPRQAGRDYASLYVDERLYSSAGYADAGEIRPKYTVDPSRLLARYRTPGELLEVGFLDAGSLRELAAAGWSVTGIDLDPTAVEAAASEGHRVFEGDLDSAPLRDESFDAVVAIAVFEHVADPRCFLAGARRVLVPGGHLLLQLPHPGSLNALVSRRSRHGWDMYGEPGHVFHYRKAHLEKLLGDAGFEVAHYGTSTIRIRGKIPFLPGRAPRLEARVARATRRHPALLGLYSAVLHFLDRLRLGDTHLVLGRKVDG